MTWSSSAEPNPDHQGPLAAAASSAKSKAIVAIVQTAAIKASEVQIGAIERAYSMLEGYSYEMEPLPVEVETEDLPKAAE